MDFHFKVLNNAAGDWIKAYIGNGEWVRIIVSSTGDAQSIKEKDEPIQNEDLVDLINQRFDPMLRKTSLSAVYGDPDFLPISFLQKGINCGEAVCRLVRYYGCAYEYIKSKPPQPDPKQDEGLEKLIAALKQVNQNRTAMKMHPYSSNDLAEILGIEDSEAKTTFFADFESAPLDALTIEKLRVLMPMAYGTGFLVGRNYLLTNHHVLPSAKEAEEFLAQFGYQKDLFGRTKLPIEYELDSSFFVTSAKLDYTLVKLHPLPEPLGDAGDNFGYLRMPEDPKTIAPPLTVDEAEKRGIVAQLSPEVQKRLKQKSILQNQPSGLPGEPVNIIQHPKGQPKQIVLSSNRMLEITDTYLRYEADANFSSSGSPVLNQQWQLVGLHHAALSDDKFNIIGQEGIRIYCIVEDLKTKLANLQIAETNINDATRVIEDLTSRWDVIEDLTSGWESIKKSSKSGLLTGASEQIQASKNADWLTPIIFDALQQAISKSEQDDKPVDLGFVQQEGLNWLKIWLDMANDALKESGYSNFSVPVPTSSEELEQLQSAGFGSNVLFTIRIDAFEIDEFLKNFVVKQERVVREYPNQSPAPA